MFVWYELDDKFGEVASGSDFWWEKNDSIIKTRKHTITEADGNLLINEVKLEIWNLRSLLNHGKHNKTVSVNIIHPSIEVTKTASPSPAAVGDEITYTYTVKNTGDVPLYDITLTDDVIGDIALTDNSLDPDETVTATDTYIAEEVGELTNTATAMGKYTIGNDECEVTDTAEFTVIITEAPVLTGNVKIIKRKTPWNYEMPELMSLSDSPGLPHEYVTFRLTQVEGELTFEGETDNDGILEFNGIPVGDYVLEEEVPEGYEFDNWCGDINEDNVISVNDNTTAVIFVLNRELPKGTIKVVKTLNERNGEPQKTYRLN